MRASRLSLAAAAALILVSLGPLAAVSAQWTQLRGDPGRSEAMPAHAGFLDVVGVDAPLPPGYSIAGRFGPYAVAAGGEMHVIGHGSDGACLLASGTAGHYRAQSLAECKDGSLQGYAPKHDLFLICMPGDGTQPILAAYHSDGSLAWAKIPQRDFPADPGTPALVEQRLNWSCQGAALLDDVAVVPFVAASGGVPGVRHGIANVTLADGTINWFRPVPLSAGVAATGQPADPGMDFVPWVVTASSHGFVVTGVVSCSAKTLCHSAGNAVASYAGAVAWMDAQGSVKSLYVSRPRIEADPNSDQPAWLPSLASAFGAAHADRVAVLAGQTLLLLVPDLDKPLLSAPLATTESPESLAWWPGPTWAGETVLVPTDHDVVSVSGSDLREQWRWSMDRRWSVVDLATDASGRIHILLVRLDAGSLVCTPGANVMGEALLVDLNRAGNEVSRLPIPASTRCGAPSAASLSSWLQAPAFLALPDGLGVVDGRGRVFALGTGQGPSLAASDLYPPLAGSVDLRVGSVGQPQTVWLDWGDGTRMDAVWPVGAADLPFNHSYNDLGPHIVAVTLVQPDGTTGTATLTLDIGGTPPPTPLQLNPIQRAFSQENQNTTWGVLGLAVALTGVVVGALRVGRRRNRMRRALGQVAALRDAAVGDPQKALLELHDLRGRLRDRIETGYFDHGEANLLEGRVASAAKGALFLAIAPFRDQLTPAYQAMLVGFFEDGRVTETEAKAALDALGRQRHLKPASKTRLRALLAALPTR